MKVTPEEDALLLRRAAAENVSVPRLLIESALSPQGETPTERRELVQGLLGLSGQLAQVSNNVNQIAHVLNTAALVERKAEELDRDLSERLMLALTALPTTLAEVREIGLRLDELAEAVAASR